MIEKAHGNKIVKHTLSQSIITGEMDHTIRDIDFPCEFLIDPETMQDVMKELKAFDSFALLCQHEQLVFSARDQLNAIEVTLRTEQSAIRLDLEEPLLMSFVCNQIECYGENACLQRTEVALPQSGMQKHQGPGR